MENNIFFGLVLSPLCSLSLGFMCGSALSVIRRRRKRYARLRRANELLKIHQAAMVQLDDPETPVELLDLVIRFGRHISDPDSPKAIELILQENPDALRADPKGTSSPEASAFSALHDKRPDLAEAFIVASVAGMKAFSTRWPQCAGAFDDVLIDFALTPAKEVAAVVTATDKARAYIESRPFDGARPSYA